MNIIVRGLRFVFQNSAICEYLNADKHFRVLANKLKAHLVCNSVWRIHWGSWINDRSNYRISLCYNNTQ